MEVAILPHGSSDETEFESSSGLSFVLCHQCPLSRSCGHVRDANHWSEKSIPRKRQQSTSSIYPYRSHDLYSTHNLIDVRARKVGFSPTTKRPTGSALVFPQPQP